MNKKAVSRPKRRQKPSSSEVGNRDSNEGQQRRKELRQFFSETLVKLNEPLLEFRFGQKVYDPRDGLSLFGPYDADESSHPKNISYGAVGTPDGLLSLKEFVKLLHYPIILREDSANLRLWTPFPGFEAAFDCSLPQEPTREFVLNERELLEASRNFDPRQRAWNVVEQYIEGVKNVIKGDEPINVIICVVPESVYLNCRPKSVVENGTGERVTAAQMRWRGRGYSGLFEEQRDLTPYKFSVDFRRQLKARVMQYNVAIQILRETTLRLSDSTEFGQRGLTPLSDRAWNLGLAFYYKSGGKPYRLSTAREGVCYVGLVYKKTDQSMENKTACCAAQMFLDTGDGVVLRSDFGAWYSPEDHQLHLTALEAKRLLSRVLSTYNDMGGKPLREVFLHYRSSITEEEYTAFKSACPPNVKVVAIRVREDRYGVHLYREGTRPIIRGSFWKVSNKVGYLWASGFKGRLGTYDGMETPVPLRIDIEFGDSDIGQVAADILGLTKLNFNECKFGDSLPVTIGFSNAVGEILVSNPVITDPNPRFKFYI